MKWLVMIKCHEKMWKVNLPGLLNRYNVSCYKSDKSDAKDNILKDKFTKNFDFDYYLLSHIPVESLIKFYSIQKRYFLTCFETQNKRKTHNLVHAALLCSALSKDAVWQRLSGNLRSFYRSSLKTPELITDSSGLFRAGITHAN